MSGKIIKKPRAKSDLVDQFVFIAADNLAAAQRFLEAAEKAFELLVENPGMGRKRDDEFRNPQLVGLRSWKIRGFEKHLIFYRSVEEGIEVMRVLHGARDLASILEDE